MINSILGLFIPHALAVADPAIASTTETMGIAVKENFLSGISTVVPYVMVIFGVMLVIAIAMRLTKRAAK